MSFCRTRGFEFSPRTPRKRALRDTEGVYEISLRTIRPLIVRNTLGTFYLWGSTPDPMPKAYIKTQRFCGIYVVNLSEGNFPNPSVSGELQASRFPCFRWLKNPASKSHFTKQNKTAAIIQFLSLFSNGESPNFLSPRLAFRHARRCW